MTCVKVGCAPTQRGPTFAPGVRLVTECLKTSRGVKVKTVSSCSRHSAKVISIVMTIKGLLNTFEQLVVSL